MFGAFFSIMSQLLGVGGGSPPPPGPPNDLMWGFDYLVWDAGNNMMW